PPLPVVGRPGLLLVGAGSHLLPAPAVRRAGPGVGPAHAASGRPRRLARAGQLMIPGPAAVWRSALPRLEPRLEWLWGGALRARRDVLAYYRQCEQQGGLVRTHIWRLPVCVISAPDLIEEVLLRKQRYFIKSGGLRSTQL